MGIRPTGQATLYTGHPLAARLVHGYVFTEGTGTTRNLVQTTVNASLEGGATWITNASGAAVSTNPGFINAGVDMVFPQAPFHIVVGFRNATDSTEGLQSLVASLQDGSVYTNAAWGLSFGYRPTDAVWEMDSNAAWSGGAQGSSFQIADATANIYNSSFHHLHLACEAAGTTLYRDGATVGTGGTTIPGVTAQPLTFGGNVGAWMNFRAEYEYVYIFSGTLTQAERDSLRTDPYGLVTPPTRFYLPSTGTTTFSTAFDSAWDDTSAVTTRPANTVKGTSAFVEVSDTEASGVNTWDVCLGRFVSEPLAAQTITGTVMGIIRARENVTGVNARSQMVVRVVSGDGTTVRGTLLPQNTTTTNINEWVITTTATAVRNARFPVGAGAATLTSVTAQDGDRIVIEVGGRAVNTATTATFTLALRFGENATDAADNETGVTEAAPWVEFSNGLAFSSGLAAQSVSGGMVSAKPTIAGTLTQTSIDRSVSGGMVSKKPTITGTLTQTSIARSVSGGMVSAKPTITGTLTQDFPARSFSGGMVSAKPLISGTLTQSAIAAQSVSGGLVSAKPVISGNLTQTFPARSVSGGMVSAKPTVTGTLTQEFPARSFSGGLVSAKPTASGTLTQTSIDRSVSGGLVSAKPTITGSITQTSIARFVSGGMVSAKPILSGTLDQEFPEAGLDGGLISPKPAITGTLTQSAIPAQSFSGGMVSAKPAITGTLVQAAIGSQTVSGGLVSAKPTISGVLDQDFPARSFSGGLVSAKPTAAGTLTQSAIAAQSVSGGMVSAKPTLSGTLTQTSIERSFTAALVSKKPIASATLTQEFPARSVSGGMVSAKPTVTGTLALAQIGSQTLSGGMISAKPRIAGTLTQEFPARSFLGGLVSKKPILSGVLDQDFPTRSVSGGMISAKPRSAGTLVQAAIGSQSVSGGGVSKKPTITGTLTQTSIARSVSGGMASAKPRLSGTLTQSALGSQSISGGLVAKKPIASGSLAQGLIAPQSVSGGMVSKKPRLSGTLTKSAIDSQTLSGGLLAKKPVVSGTLTQTFPARTVSGGAVAKKSRAGGFLSQSSIPAQSFSAALISAKPRLSGTSTQTFPARSLTGRLLSIRPRLSGTLAQGAIAPQSFSGGLIGPRPRTKGLFLTEVQPVIVSLGIALASGGQLALASGHIVLLADDPEGELPVAHPLAIPQRTVEAGFGAEALQFEGPLDPAELKYFTIRWDVELTPANDSIVPDTGAIEGQSVFLTLSGPAVASGLQVHAFSQDDKSVTFWLKIDPAQQNRVQWMGTGELHIITVRVITVRGQVFERDVSFRVKQL